MEINLKDLNIKEIKEDINLMMFNSKNWTLNDMIVFNNLMEVISNAKISINID